MNKDSYDDDAYGNFDEDLYKASINITEVLPTVLPNNNIVYTVSYEFLAQYSDGQRWVKDTALYGGDFNSLSLKDFKKRILESVKRVRQTLRHTKLNGEEA